MPSKFFRYNTDLRKSIVGIGRIEMKPAVPFGSTKLNGKWQQAKLQLFAGLSPLPIDPFVFSIKNTMRPSLRSVISTLSPVSRMRLGISITDSGSVHSTSSRSPGKTDFSSFGVFSAGNGHFRPARSSFVVVMRSGWRTRLASSTRSIGQAGPGQEADDLAGRDLRDVLRKFGKAVGIGQRRQEAR